jgi:hypothetical protein
VKTFQALVGPPELTPSEGMNFRLTHRYIRIEAQSGYRSIDLAQSDGVLLALDWVVGDAHHIWGSAVMVGPGVALTARHTVDAMRHEGFLRDGESGGYLLALGFYDHGMVIWHPNSFASIGDGDLAILTLLRSKAQPASVAHIATLAARQPPVGEIVSLIGFAASKSIFENLPPDDGPVVDLLGSVGPVADLYPKGRDRHTLPNPAAGVSAKTVGGMSGGGAFDAQGRLIGIITSGIDETSSFISMSWPSVFTPIEIAWLPSLIPEPTTLHALAQRGFCRIEHIEAVRSHVDEKGEPFVSLRFL